MANVLNLKRRTFISSAFISTAAITIGIDLKPWSLLGNNQDDIIHSHRHLFSVLLPVFLDGILPKTMSFEKREHFHNQTLLSMSENTNKLNDKQKSDLSTLLNLLDSRLGSLLLTAEMTHITHRSANELITMLNVWREGFMSLQQMAYFSLRELILASFYSIPEHWSLISYSKPSFT